MAKLLSIATCAAVLLLSLLARAQAASETPNAAYEPELARSLGADESGMKRYVLVVLKSGPTLVPAGPERDEMFKGHFANMSRLAARESSRSPDRSTAPTAGAACSSSRSPTSPRRRRSSRPTR